MSNPRFSIIIPHYDGVVSDQRFIECLKSVESQTFTDYEVLVYHDGPISRPLPFVACLETKQFNGGVKISKERKGDWRHSLRSRGIKGAKGEYIFHLNADNIIYPNCLEELNKLSRSTSPFLDDTNPDLLVMPIIMRGYACNGNTSWRSLDYEEYSTILTGFPPEMGNIDCMQLIMKRDIWIKEGAWDIVEKDSDGIMYPHFILKYLARYCGKVLGEHR